MSEDQGYVRVVNIRADDDDFRAVKGQRVIMIDRTHPVLGNRHVMKTKSRLERVIDEYGKDIEADIATGGPMSKAILTIAKDIVDNNAHIGAGCW